NKKNNYLENRRGREREKNIRIMSIGKKDFFGLCLLSKQHPTKNPRPATTGRLLTITQFLHFQTPKYLSGTKTKEALFLKPAVRPQPPQKKSTQHVCDDSETAITRSFRLVKKILSSS